MLINSHGFGKVHPSQRHFVLSPDPLEFKHIVLVPRPQWQSDRFLLGPAQAEVRHINYLLVFCVVNLDATGLDSYANDKAGLAKAEENSVRTGRSWHSPF